MLKNTLGKYFGADGPIAWKPMALPAPHKFYLKNKKKYICLFIDGRTLAYENGIVVENLHDGSVYRFSYIIWKDSQDKDKYYLVMNNFRPCGEYAEDFIVIGRLNDEDIGLRRCDTFDEAEFYKDKQVNMARNILPMIIP